MHYQRQVDLYLNPENDCRRALGLPLIISLTMTTVVAAISMIVEPIIKGLGNILGSHYTKDCSFLTGLTHLFAAPLAILVVAAISPIIGLVLAIGIITLPIFAAIIPDQIHKDLSELLTFQVSTLNPA